MGKTHRRWNKETIISLIQKKHADGEKLNPGSVKKSDSGLYGSAINHFGGWPAAIAASGLDYSKILLRRAKKAGGNISPDKKPKPARRDSISSISRKQLSILEDRELLELAKKVKKKRRGWMEARNKIVEHNRRLVIAVASKFSPKFSDPTVLFDLIQEGEIGLIRAVEEWNPKRAKLSTYSYWWIRQSIQRAIEDRFGLVRVPPHKHTIWNKVRRVTTNFKNEFGRLPNERELARILNLPDSKVRKLLVEMESTPNDRTVMSLDASPNGNDSGEEDAGSLAGILKDPSSLAPDRILERETESVEPFEDFFRSLRDSEKNIRIFKMVNGLDSSGFEAKTLQEVGDHFNLSRERIRQIVKRIATKLHHWKFRKELELE